MMKRALFVVLLCALSASAQAFNLVVKSENPQIAEDALRSAALQIAGQVGNQIPDDANVKVWVYSRAVPSKDQPSRLVYLHKIELRRAFATDKAPYPYRGFLALRTTERYGADEPAVMRAQLDEALKEFFTRMKGVDPGKGFGD